MREGRVGGARVVAGTRPSWTGRGRRSRPARRAAAARRPEPMIAICTPVSGVPTAPMWLSWCSGRNSVVIGDISVCPNSSAKSQPKLLQAAADQFVRHRSHRVDGAAQAGGVPAGEGRVVQCGPEHHRQAEDLGDVLALDQVKPARRVEAAQHVDSRADQDRGRAERVQLRGVEHRHHRGEPVGAVPAGIERARHRLQVDGEVGTHHALGEGGRARGIQVADRIAVLDVAVRLRVRRLRQLPGRQPVPICRLGLVVRLQARQTMTSVTAATLPIASCIAATSWVSTARPRAPEWSEDVGHLVGRQPRLMGTAHHAESWRRRNTARGTQRCWPRRCRARLRDGSRGLARPFASWFTHALSSA